MTARSDISWVDPPALDAEAAVTSPSAPKTAEKPRGEAVAPQAIRVSSTPAAPAALPEFEDKPRRRHWLMWLALLAIPAGAAIGVWQAWDWVWPPLSVRVLSVERGPVEEAITADGIVRPLREVPISSEIAGRILTMDVREGQHVEAGQVLFTIEAEYLRSRIPTWEAQREHAVRMAAEAESRKAYRKKELARLEQLQQRQPSAVKEQAYDEALSQHQMADAQYQAALADIRRIDAELARAMVELDRSVVRAPFAGIVDSIELEVGELVAMGFGEFSTPATNVMTLVDTSDVYVEAEIAEADVGLVRAGQSARITSDALPDHLYQGTLERVQLHARQKQILTRYERAGEEKVFLADVKLDEPTQRKADLRPGLTVYVSVGIARRDGVRLPRSCVWAEENSLVAYVVRDGRLQRRVLRVGLKGEEHIEVLEGLQAGERVVLRGSERVKDGLGVQVIEDDRPQR